MSIRLLVLKLSLFLHRYGDAVEEYLDIYLRAADLPKDDIVRALVVPGRALHFLHSIQPLFYWTLSQSYTNKKRKQSDLIREWAAAVPRAQQRQARLARLLPKPVGILKRLESARSFRTTSRRSGFGIDSSRRMWPLSAKLWSRGMCPSSGQSR